MSIAIAVMCEESQRITTEFRNLGIEAYSFDLMPCSGNHPEWHVQGDCLPYINGNCTFTTMDGKKHTIDGKWTCIIAHPPCIFLTVAANKLYNIERYGQKAIDRLAKREEAADFFMKFINADCDHIAVENPIGVMSTRYRKPDQIIQPYHYGDSVAKSTCLWLKNLPLLEPTNIVEPERIHSKGKSGGYSGSSWVVRDENGKILPYRDPRVSIIRSKTYPGIAQAVANQWGNYLLKGEI